MLIAYSENSLNEKRKIEEDLSECPACKVELNRLDKVGGKLIKNLSSRGLHKEKNIYT